MIFYSVDWNLSNIWYVSDDGSDYNDCHSVSAPCRNLQTVLDRATDGTDIYVTSDTLALDGNFIIETTKDYFIDLLQIIVCTIESPLSYTISHLNDSFFTVTCGTNVSRGTFVGIS